MEYWMSSESKEWYTPEKYIESARRVMGTISLDPASNPVAQRTVKAAQWYGPSSSWATDGLETEWPAGSTVFLNPPYGKTGNRSNADIWAGRMIDAVLSGQAKTGIFLCKVRHLGLNNVQRMLAGPSATCITDHRIKFYDVTGSVQKSPPGSNVFILLHDDDQGASKFDLEFRHYGAILWS